MRSSRLLPKCEGRNMDFCRWRKSHSINVMYTWQIQKTWHKILNITQYIINRSWISLGKKKIDRNQAENKIGVNRQQPDLYKDQRSKHIEAFRSLISRLDMWSVRQFIKPSKPTMKLHTDIFSQINHLCQPPEWQKFGPGQKYCTDLPRTFLTRQVIFRRFGHVNIFSYRGVS